MRKSYSHISVRVYIEFWLALHAYTDARTFLHQTLTFIQTLTHTPFNTYTHLHTHLATCILHTNSIRRLSGRAAGINFTSTVTLNPFQKTYNRPSKIIFRETRKNYYGKWPPQGGPGFAVRVRCPFFRFHSATFWHIDLHFIEFIHATQFTWTYDVVLKVYATYSPDFVGNQTLRAALNRNYKSYFSNNYDW